MVRYHSVPALFCLGEMIYDLTFPSPIHQIKDQSVGVSAPSEGPLRRAFGAWREQQRLAAQEVLHSTVGRLALSLLILSGGTDASRMRVWFCIWRKRVADAASQRATGRALGACLSTDGFVQAAKSCVADLETSSARVEPSEVPTGDADEREELFREDLLAFSREQQQLLQRQATGAAGVPEELITAEEPQIAAEKPQIVSEDPQSGAEEPQIVEQKPLIIGEEPHTAMDEPKIAVKQRCFTAGDKRCSRGSLCVWCAVICLLTLLGHSLLLAATLRRGEPQGVLRSPVDSDGDGVRDEVDACPSSARPFQSTWETDWDGDGCLDSLEDQDDDNDSVPNVQDMCSRTSPSPEGVDLYGCSPEQRRRPQPDEAGGYDYAKKLCEILVEVVLGFFLTACMNLPSVSERAKKLRCGFLLPASPPSVAKP